MTSDFVKIATLRSVSSFRSHLTDLGISIPCDEEVLSAPDSPLAQPIDTPVGRIGNRFAIQPMEGWDGTSEGRPSEKTIRRWRRFGQSGAKLIWGGEAVAVRHDGRANPNQLLLNSSTQGSIAGLREELIRSHVDPSDLVVGLQLTHSGRWSKPNRDDRSEPRIAYRHPILDVRQKLPADFPILTDGEIEGIIGDCVIAAKRAQECGFDFVDVKHCHSYLGHELLSAVTRPGRYGGSLENRIRFLREIVAGIRRDATGLGIGIRLSAFDLVPYHPDPEQSQPGKPGPGIFESYCDFMPYIYAFGLDSDQPTDIDLTEVFAFFEILRELDVRFVNLTAGSPYYNPHIQRPALYPPSDGYLPPEDPLIGVARQMVVTRYLKEAFPDFTFVGSAYSYLQEFLPNVAQAAVREGWVDLVGLGRMVLSYPELPRDVLESGRLQRKLLCRTFSDCTTAPRNGLVSGCYPLDPYYKRSAEAVQLASIKRQGKILAAGDVVAQSE